MEYATRYDVGDRKRASGINEDSVAVSVFEQGHRSGLRASDDAGAGDPDGVRDGDPAGAGRDATREGTAGDGSDDPESRSAFAFALADGAGGHDAGDVASYLATTRVLEELSPVAARAARSDPDPFGIDVSDAVLPGAPDDESLEAAVEAAVVAAHRDVVRYADESGTAAYTTLVAGICVGGRCHYGWVGDSRAYVVNAARDRIELLTKDHAVVEQLRDQGEVDDVAAHVHPRGNEITRALGGTGEADPDTATVPVDTESVPMYADDVLFVTSDGLIDAQTDAPTLYDRYVESGRDEEVAASVREAVVTDAELRDHVLRAASLGAAADDLIDLANERGGKDNLSLLLARDPALPPTPDDRPLRRALEPEPLEDRATVILREE
ncbi:PP2C family protein-serine/threonine phosphatase [Halomicrobium salinisoli]|uniref:PP2C family protein-serine/threonine phosphatase n=1 Tax=Halomicrobium salinisoli TaxID=2878391 RepID=UPI001CEFF931|nr:protein phosphatase 2C domain-containing protein [Halomicrobium salinisoli]